MHNKKMDQIINYQQAAIITGLPVGTLYALVSKKHIPHIKLGPRLIRFSKLELKHWLNEHEVKVPKGVKK